MKKGYFKLRKENKQQHGKAKVLADLESSGQSLWVRA
jgi:hypothetical protein